ncbi:HAD-IIB family hydrolase [Mycoplasma sp. 1654_15]|uniref:HAD-IIB family hydrolase n=1 Tax=Mycoplasma sp. 1654_15 TaxID=2725994 RepID=UPI001449150A|nr:HAD-IIB family hydrolase [Mycoplasma sp. 1654_15]QJB71122.1 HAD-IIB family hydrolase [Mycoplasma sp. 1654_15]
MNKNYVFSDVDGTIYGTEFQFTNETQKFFIEKKSEMNFEIIITTGNPYMSRIKKLAEELQVKYIISSNGALFTDLIENKEYIISSFSKKIQKQVLNIAKKHNLQVNFWNNKEYFCFNFIENTNFLFNYALLDNSVVKFTNTTHDDILKMELYGSAKSLDLAYLECKDIEEINISFSVGSHIELTTKPTSKGYTLEYVCKNIFQEDIQNVMAVGDSENDISMLSVVGYSYAMANSIQYVKTFAKYHTSAYNQEGVVMAIKDFLYRKSQR